MWDRTHSLVQPLSPVTFARTLSPSMNVPAFHVYWVLLISHVSPLIVSATCPSAYSFFWTKDADSFAVSRYCWLYVAS